MCIPLLLSSLSSNQSNADNLSNVRHEASRHFRNKKMEYMKAEIDELEINSKVKNFRYLHRGIIVFKKGYQSRSNIAKDEKGDLVTGSHSILASWQNHFSQLLNVHGVNNVRPTETHTAEPVVPS